MAAKKGPEPFLDSAVLTHAWSPDRKRVAIGNNTREVLIYEVTGDDCRKWKLQTKLERHDQTVTSVDWAPDGILSCSEDRSAIQWVEKDGVWTSVVVTLSDQMNRGALCCQWSPNQKKLAVSTAAGLTTVCRYDESNNWWIFTKHTEPHSSSVKACAFCPVDDTLLATAGTDGVVRVSHVYVKGADPAEKKGKFGVVQAEWKAGAWVHGLCWNPAGLELAWVSHDSTVTFATLESQEVQKVYCKQLPFLAVAWVAPDVVVAAGHDCYPVCFTRKNSDSPFVASGRWVEKQEKPSGELSARDKFVNQAAFGQAEKVEKLPSKHQSPITSLKVIEFGDNFKFSTGALDGFVYVWTQEGQQPI